MKKLLLLATLALTGCYQVTSAGDILAAQKACDGNGGINHITVDFDGFEKVKCQNEHSYTLHSSRDTN